MSKTDSKTPRDIVLCTEASRLLAEAKTVGDFKKVADLAAAAATWAKRAGLGKEAVAHAQEYQARAMRGMGLALAAMPKNPGAKGNPGGRGNKNVRCKSVSAQVPKLSDLGVSYRESSDAQTIAAIPEKEFESKVRKMTVSALVKTQRKQAKNISEREAMKKAAASVNSDREAEIRKRCDVRVCSCSELFKSGIRPEAVICDPPYPEKFLPVFTELAKACKNVPIVAVMVGQSYLPEIIRRLTEFLTYRWTVAYLTPGGQSVQQWQAKVNCFWKPVLLFGKSRSWIGDVAKSSVNDNDKDHHEWGQSESGMADLVTRLTKPGSLVCDPFVGGGTTAVVSLALGRRFVGCDIDPKCVKETMLRVMAAK